MSIFFPLSYICVTGKPVEMRQLLLRHANNIISRMTVGKKSNEANDEVGKLRKLILDVGDLFGAFNLGDVIGFMWPLDLQGFEKKNKETNHKLDIIIEKFMKERREERKKNFGSDSHRKKDLFDMLLNLIEADDSADNKLTRESAKALALDMFFGGTNGPASGLEWTIAEIIRNPHVLEKAREEIDSVVGTERLVRQSDIPNLPYLQAVVKETLRLHPPVPIFAREANRNIQIEGYDITAHSKIVINTWAIGRDPNYWDNPSEYSPEIFLVTEQIRKKQIDVRGQFYQLFPFGSGRRCCPGTSPSLLVIQATAACLIRCFDWVANDGKDFDVDMSEVGRVTLFMAKELKYRPVACFVSLLE